jgi:hypothetical protein
LQLRNAELGPASVPVDESLSARAGNVYLPKSLIGRVDRRAAEFGMSRSSFFGFAVTQALSIGSVWGGLAEPRSKVHKTGGLRTKTTARKP